MQQIRFYLTSCFLCGLFFVFLSCDPVTESNEKWIIDYPKGGEQLKIGDNIKISFKANRDLVGSVGVQITSNKGEDYFLIKDSSVPIDKKGFNTYTLNWTIGNEDEFDKDKLYGDQEFAPDTDPKWTCLIKIYDYQNQKVSIKSDEFTVTMKKPLYIRYPVGGESYKKSSETMEIFAMYRTDQTTPGGIEYFFWSLEDEDWSQIKGLTTTASTASQGNLGNYKLATDVKKFVLSSEQIYPLGDSTRIRVADYSNDKAVMTTGWITIKK